MISKILTLIVFGATIASAQFMPRLIRPTPYDMSLMPYLRPNGCPSGPALAPVICQFMQPSLNFKPQLIAPSTYIPPLVVEKCEEPQIDIEIPTLEHIVIPEAPILPPITVQKFPLPVIPEPVPPMPIVEPCEPGPVAVSSAVSVPVAPVLPPLEMPALPEIVEYHGADMSGAVVNDIDYQSMLGLYASSIAIPEPVPVRPLAPIPPAPILPPAPLPEIPVHVEVPARPIAPPMVIEEPCITDVVVHKPMLPSPAKLPLPLPMPMPIFPMLEPASIAELYETAIAPMPILPKTEPAIMAEPCDPAIAPVVKMPGRPILRPSPAFLAPGTRPVLFPAHMMKGNLFASLPYMRRI